MKYFVMENNSCLMEVVCSVLLDKKETKIKKEERMAQDLS
jgi:hypothetical protein